MDVYYMSDSMHYGSLRSPLYRDYEKFPYGTLENPLNSPPKSGHQRQQQHQLKGAYDTAQGKSKKKPTKESCPFCKEQKKRPLGAYMRKRGQRINSESISEDIEECGEEQEFTEGDTNGSPAGSPSNNDNLHHHQHIGRHVVSGGYSRQDSQDSDGK